jgi:very-short-patch-repair endonuclease
MRDPRLVEYAKQMRREMTEPEMKLWFELRAKRFRNIKFRKQKVIGPYIADFAAREPKLVIELDGDTHSKHEIYDAKRTAYLQGQGYQVIRFSNRDVMKNLSGVLERLDAVIDQMTAPLPTLSPEGERAILSPSPSGEGLREGESLK